MSIFSITDMKKIYESETYTWSGKLKDVSAKKLAKTMQEIIKKAGEKDHRYWNFSGKMLSELHLRKYAKKHTKELELFKKQIKSKSSVCVASPSYSVETAGIQESAIVPKGRDDKIIHPYARVDEAKKLVQNWGKSKSQKTFSKYVKTNLSSAEKNALNAANVKYLVPSEYKKYRVSFDGGKIKIGKKHPKDGNYIFALNADGKELLAAKKIRGKFHHTSFFGGAPVQCAGDFDLKSRKMKVASLVSGHYKPATSHGENFRTFLGKGSNLGAKKAKNLEIRPWHHH